MPPAPTTAAAEEGEEVPPAKRNREEKEPEVDEARVARLAYALFGTPTDSEPETEPPESSFPPPSPSSSSTSDDDKDFTAEGLRARDAALSVCKSVVSLAASIDEDPQSTLACTGTVVAHRGPATWIMTSAALIRKCESDTEVHETSIVKIEVLLPNKKVASGQVLMYDLQYNIVIVSIECQANLPVVAFTDLPVSYFLTPGPVVAIARKFESGRLRVKRGETFRTVSKLDCDELMVSTRQIEQIFIGGLLMDLDKRIVGMNFIDEKTTPFLPVEVVRRCMRHFETYGEIKRPWLGLRGRSFHLLELANLQQICHQFPKPPSGVLVDMIHEASSANCEGIEVGDILNQVDGVVLHSAAQFGSSMKCPHPLQSVFLRTHISSLIRAPLNFVELMVSIPSQLTSMLLDKMEVASHTHEPVILKACIQRPRGGATFSADLKVVGCPPGEREPLYKNRWRLPQPKVYWWGPPELSEWMDDSD